MELVCIPASDFVALQTNYCCGFKAFCITFCLLTCNVSDCLRRQHHDLDHNFLNVYKWTALPRLWTKLTSGRKFQHNCYSCLEIPAPSFFCSPTSLKETFSTLYTVHCTLYTWLVINTLCLTEY